MSVSNTNDPPQAIAYPVLNCLSVEGHWSKKLTHSGPYQLRHESIQIWNNRNIAIQNLRHWRQTTEGKEMLGGCIYHRDLPGD